jgi:hypothetical protein
MQPCADNLEQMMDHELAAVREWAQGRLDALEETPWATQRYQHMIAVIDGMLGRRTIPPLPQGENIVHISSARRRGQPRHCRTNR